MLKPFITATLLLALVSGAALASSGEHFVTIPAAAFTVREPNSIFGEFFPPGPASGHLSRYCNYSFCTFLADARLPHGSTIVGLELDACVVTSGSTGLGVSLLAVNFNENLTGGTDPFRVEVQSPDLFGGGCGFTKVEAPVRREVDQFSKTYLVRIRMADLNVLCGPFGVPCGGVGTRFSAVRVFYEPNEEGAGVPSKPLSTVFFP